jgi:UDP-N-acetylmuramoylalanine--D-glutamate ligase
MPSSPPLRWTDLRTSTVGVWGIGVEGRATLTKLTQLGIEAAAIVDDQPSDDYVLATNRGGLEALSSCEVVIKSPGISRYSDEVAELESAGVAVVGGLGLWLEEVGSGSVLGVTGTKGKSTTATLAGHLAQRLGRRCSVGGNIGLVPWSGEAPSDVDLWVVEISSYQATDLWSSPAVVAVTSLHEDHIDWHGSVSQYYADKLSVCGKQGAVVTVANGTDARLRSRAEQLRPGPRWIDPNDAETSWTHILGLRGRHNITNALIAAACLQEFGIVGADDPRRLATAAAGYKHLPHRLETIAVIAGVEYVDDSLSTNVLPTIAAAEVFDGRPLALLVGGFDRDIDYSPLAEFVVARSTPTLVLALPTNGARIKRAITAAGGDAVSCSDIDDAVRHAAAWAPADGVVLLSPAAPSYGLYPNYIARSAAFRLPSPTSPISTTDHG